MKLNAQKMRIVGVYAPNRSQDRFWETVYNELLVELQGPVLMMVDFNAFLKNHLDRSESDTPVFSATCLNYKKDFCLSYVWRLRNGNVRDHIFYSYCHNSY